MSNALIFGHLLTLLIIGAGTVWTPEVAGLTPVGIPFSTPDVVSIVSALLAIALLQSRRRYTKAHRSWKTVSAPLEVGMRSGLVLMDLALAGMFILQNLRWHEGSNLLAIGALVLSTFLVIAPLKRIAVRVFAVLTIVLSTSSLIALLGDASWLEGDDTLGSGLTHKVLLILAGTVFAAVSTPLLYRVTAHPRALRGRGVLTDLSIKAACIFLLSSLVLSVMERTPWPWTAPFIALAVFFSGLVLYRSSFARLFSPETLGFALFLVRLRPSWVKPLIIRSLLTAIVVVTPLTIMLCVFFLLGNYDQAAVLLVALVALEISVDALAVQRRTAVMPASHISKLAQKSKAGLGAALCAGLAVVFSGVLGTAAPQATQGLWLTIASGALSLVAALLTALVFIDAPAWLRELSATETEDT
ncbi:hypothetical protein [Arthrobacter bambusae]|uniref:hypothetical protein n=1 Tax=Arthrobacter bambusae TaxID=1338426 RepID=UPI00277FE600|nr:hypothetical protein [Arthrobacter bambusae]MDQ0028304.1 hypothetical protein [Arthrobacter bambusae]MDQ0096902.1 hypothetical protein [Arthrobacter bambusae]